MHESIQLSLNHNDTSDNLTEITSKEKGNSLENAVEHIFRAAKFTTEKNVFIAKYEIDVKATIGDRTIIIECKNYQNSSLTIRNLVHQWNSKNQLIGAHKVVIVLAGMVIKESDRMLANEFDMDLWDENDLSELFSLTLKPDQLRSRLLEKISLKPITIAERYREEITQLVIKPLLTNSLITKESLYWHFNRWLRSHILTELQMDETTYEERTKHIELFEKNKTKKVFLTIKSQRNQFDYWNTVLNQMANSEILSLEKQQKYLSYMEDLVDEYKNQQSFFKGDDYKIILRRLISSRLRNAIFLNQTCRFKINKNFTETKVAYLGDGTHSIKITSIGFAEANILNWILTSHYHVITNKDNKKNEFVWFSSSFEETTEKVYRIFIEFLNISPKDTISDLELINRF